MSVAETDKLENLERHSAYMKLREMPTIRGRCPPDVGVEMESKEVNRKMRQRQLRLEATRATVDMFVCAAN